MKNTFKLFLSILVIGTFFGCQDEINGDNIRFDPVNGQTLVQWGSSTFSAFAEGNGDVTYQVPVEVTTVSTSDRTFPVSLDQLGTTALANQYTVGSSITVPANSHIGFLEVTAIESNLATDPVNLRMRIEEGNGYLVENGTVNISLFIACPLPDGFLTGMYELDTGLPCLNGGCFGNSPIVVNVVDEGNDRRSFTANYLSQFNIGQPDMTFTFTLLCERAIVDDEQGTFLACGGNSLTIGAAAMASSFDDTDDSFIEINFTDDSISSCGGATQSSITLTKI